MQCISYNCPIVNDMWAEIDRLREKYNAVVAERGEDYSVTQQDIINNVPSLQSSAKLYQIRDEISFTNFRTILSKTTTLLLQKIWM